MPPTIVPVEHLAARERCAVSARGARSRDLRARRPAGGPGGACAFPATFERLIGRVAMDIRRLLVVCDTVNSEGGLPAIAPVTRVAACAVIGNPLAGVARDDARASSCRGRRAGRASGAQGAGGAAEPGGALRQGRDRRHSTAISSMPPPSSIRAWASRCARPSAAARRSFPRTSRSRRPAPRSTCRSSDRDDVWVFDHIDTITVVVPRRAASGRDRRDRCAQRRRPAAAAHRQGWSAAAHEVIRFSSCAPARRDGRGQRPRR